MERWDDDMAMLVLIGSQFLIECEEAKESRVGKRILNYYWSNDNLMFKGLVLPRPNERRYIILDLHYEIAILEKGGHL
jgi:hypothetical protein